MFFSSFYAYFKIKTRDYPEITSTMAYHYNNVINIYSMALSSNHEPSPHIFLRYRFFFIIFVCLSWSILPPFFYWFDIVSFENQNFINIKNIEIGKNTLYNISYCILWCEKWALYVPIEDISQGFFIKVLEKEVIDGNLNSWVWTFFLLYKFVDVCLVEAVILR